MAYIIEKKYCVGCGACAFACPFNVPVYDQESNTYSIPADKCIGCGQCMDICPGAAIYPSFDQKKVVRVTINPEKCIGCSLCSRRCPAGAISGKIKSPYVIDHSLCIQCGACLKACKQDAIDALYTVPNNRVI